MKIASLDNVGPRKDPEEDKRREKAAAEALRKQNEAADRLRRQQMAKLNRALDTTFSAPVKMRITGGGSRSMEDYGAMMVRIYQSKWDSPAELAGSRYVVSVSVTVRKDGTVSSSRIVKRSGLGNVDSSVQRALDRVGRFRPFPDSETAASKTFTIDFDLGAVN